MHCGVQDIRAGMMTEDFCRQLLNKHTPLKTTGRSAHDLHLGDLLKQCHKRQLISDDVAALYDRVREARNDALHGEKTCCSQSLAAAAILAVLSFDRAPR